MPDKKPRRHCERSEAIQENIQHCSGLPRRCARNDEAALLFQFLSGTDQLDFVHDKKLKGVTNTRSVIPEVSAS